jgi:hypothetical protein
MLTSYATQPPFDSNGSLSYNDFCNSKGAGRSFSSVACTFHSGWSRMTLNSGSEPVTIQGAFVPPNLFTVFGREPIIGRTFTPEENLRADRVVVISEGLWAQQFGSSPRVIGQDLVSGPGQWRVIGVMPSNFQVPFLDTKLWAPVRSHPEWNDKEENSPLSTRSQNGSYSIKSNFRHPRRFGRGDLASPHVPTSCKGRSSSLRDARAVTVR